MKRSAPVLIHIDGQATQFRRLSLIGGGDRVSYNETFLDDLLFQNPSLLPVEDFDSAFSGPIPICKELQTSAGPLDILYVTASGRIIIVENKLWRNPDARRKVIAQLLDYASAVSRWSYEDLQREVSKKVGRHGNALFEIINAVHPDLNEADFVDNVSRNLKHGRFLLLICGDGIREGTSKIAQFLDQKTALDFTFGLVELAIYESDENDRLVIPHVLAKTHTIPRTVIRLPDGFALEERDDLEDQSRIREQSPTQQTPWDFWTELSEEIEFDDPMQLPPNPTSKSYVSLRMPTSRAWILFYFDKSKNTMGLHLTFSRGSEGDEIYAALLEDKSLIDDEIPDESVWSSDGEKHYISLKRERLEASDPIQRADAKAWFQLEGNRFVNAFRPRIQDWVDRNS